MVFDSILSYHTILRICWFVLLLISIYEHLQVGPGGMYQSCMKLRSHQFHGRLLSGGAMSLKMAAYSFKEGVRSQQETYIDCQNSIKAAQKVTDTSLNNTYNSILP